MDNTKCITIFAIAVLLLSIQLQLLVFGSIALNSNTVAIAPENALIVPDDYSTIQEAIDNASAGDTVFVKKGTYYCGPANRIVIQKSLSLIGEDANATIINGQFELYYPRPGDYSTVTIGASNVLITGFTITNCENAIAINQYANSYTVSGIRIVGNNLIGNMVGISDEYTSIDSNVIVSNNNIINNSVVGLRLYSENSVISSNLFSSNHIALSLTQTYNITVSYNKIVNNSYGLTLGLVSGASIFGNNITGNAGYYSPDDYGYGISFASNCNNSLVYDNNIWGNTHGIILRNVGLESSGIPIPQGSGNVVYHNNLFSNSQNAIVVAGVVNNTMIVSWDNGTVGNYWGDYHSKYPAAIEVDASGVGNTPYRIDENNIDHYPLIQQVSITGPEPTPSSGAPISTILVIVLVVLAVVVISFVMALVLRRKKK